MAMSRPLTEELKEDFIHCSVCMERYQNPRMLPCVHSFCLRCLEKCEQTLGGKSFTCPTCRGVAKLPPNGVKGLPNNFFIVNLMEKLDLADKFSKGATSKCSLCQTAMSELYCLECKLYLCKPCRMIHSRIPGTEGHAIAETKHLSNPQYMKQLTVDQAPRCEKHPAEKLRFFCNNCCRLVCRDCMLLSHQGHGCVEATSRAETVKRNLETALARIDVGKKRGERKSLVCAAKNVHAQSQCARAEIESHCAELVARIQADTQRLVAEVERIEAQHCKVLKDKTTEMANWIKSAENTQSMTRKILQEDNEWQIIGMEKHLIGAIDKLTPASSSRSFGSPSRFIVYQPASPSRPLASAASAGRRCDIAFRKSDFNQFFATNMKSGESSLSGPSFSEFASPPQGNWQAVLAPPARQTATGNFRKVDNLLGEINSSSR